HHDHPSSADAQVDRTLCDVQAFRRGPACQILIVRERLEHARARRLDRALDAERKRVRLRRRPRLVRLLPWLWLRRLLLPWLRLWLLRLRRHVRCPHVEGGDSFSRYSASRPRLSTRLNSSHVKIS